MASTNLYDLIDTPDNRFSLQNGILGSLRSSEELSSSDYYLDNTQRKILAGYGINTSYKGYIDHPHPMSATIERHCLRVISSLCKGFGITVLSSKRSKVDKFFGKRAEVDNPIIVPRDTYRYVDNGATDYGSVGTTHAVLHDVLHSITPSKVVDIFDQSTDLTHLYATLVFPREHLTGCPHLHGDTYSSEVVGDELWYYPDGHREGGYSQPLSSGDHLTYHLLTRGDTSITCTLVDSFSSHHILLFTRRHLDVAERRFFDTGHQILFNPIWRIWSKVPRYSCPTVLFDKLVLSLLSAGQWSRAQVFTRCRAICTEQHIEQKPDLIATAVDFAIASALPLRDQLDVHYPHQRFRHNFTRCWPMVFLRSLFNRNFWLYSSQISRLHNPARTHNVLTRHLNLPVGPGLPPRTFTSDIWGYAGNLANVLEAAVPARYTCAPLYGSILVLALLNSDLSLAPYPGLREIVEVPKLRYNQILAELPIFVIVWFSIARLFRSLGLFLWSYYSAGLQSTCRFICSFDSRTAIVLGNLEKLSTGRIPVPVRSSRPTDNCIAADPRSELRSLKFDFGNFGSVHQSRNDGRTFIEQCVDYLQANDPSALQWYCVGPNSRLSPRHHFNRWDSSMDVCRDRSVVCPPDGILGPIPLPVAYSLLGQRPHDFVILCPDRTAYAEFIFEARSNGYDVVVRSKGFTGKASAIHCHRAGRTPFIMAHERSAAREDDVDEVPDLGSDPLHGAHDTQAGNSTETSDRRSSPAEGELPTHADAEGTPGHCTDGPHQQDSAHTDRRTDPRAGGGAQPEAETIFDGHSTSRAPRVPVNGSGPSDGTGSSTPDSSRHRTETLEQGENVRRNAAPSAGSSENTAHSPPEGHSPEVDNRKPGPERSEGPKLGRTDIRTLPQKVEDVHDCRGRSRGRATRDNQCLIIALANELEHSVESIEDSMAEYPHLARSIRLDLEIDIDHLDEWANDNGFCLEFHNVDDGSTHTRGANRYSNARTCLIDYSPQAHHATCCTCETNDLLSAYRETQTLELDRGRMKAYLDLIKKERYGVVLPDPKHRDLLNGLEASLMVEPRKVPVQAFVILGHPGSGKSSGFKNRLIRYFHGARSERWVMAFHSTFIRDKFKDDVDAKHDLANIGSHLVTPELAFLGPTHVDVLCIDELGKWKPGEAELLIYHLKPKLVILNGDTIQGRHPVYGLSDAVRDGVSFLDVAAKSCKVFLNYSHRLPCNYSSIFGFPCYGPPAPLPRKLNYPKLGSTVLATNNSTVSAYLHARHPAMTFNSSQGWDTSERYLLVINHQTALTDNGNIHSAITRSSSGFDYIVSGGDLQGEITDGDVSSTLLKKMRPDNILRALLLADFSLMSTLELQHQAASLPLHLRDPAKLSRTLLGRSKPAPALLATQGGLISDDQHWQTDHVVNQRLAILRARNPDFHQVDNLLLCPTISEEEPPEERLESAPMVEHFSTIGDTSLHELDAICLDHFGAPLDKFSRETIFRGNLTNQVVDGDVTEQLFIKHSSKDPTCMPMGLKARVRPRTRRAEDELISHVFGTDALIACFKHLTGKDSVAWDPSLYEARRLRAYENLVYKDANLNLSKAYKTALDTKESYTYLLLKQQYVNKIGKIYAKAKNPQILTEYVFRVALDLGPVFMYFLIKFQELVRPRRIYLHPTHSDEQFVDFIKENWDFSKESMEDDATNWDSNVGPALIGFGYFLFDYFNAPPELKERYVRFKNDMHALHMAIAFMMASGGPDTLPLNTIWMTMVQEIRCEIPRGAARIHGGDDVAINAVMKISDWWNKYAHYIPEEFKPVRTYHPTCFGWRVYPEPHRDPATTLARVLYSIRTDRISRTITDLLATAQQLAQPSCYEQFDSVDRYHADAALSLLIHYRKVFRVRLKGTNNAIKAGAVRRYNVENSSLFNVNI